MSFAKLYLTDHASQQMWDEDEKDIFFSYSEGQKIVARILAFSEELEYKKLANQVNQVLLDVYDQYYEVYYCRSADFIKQKAFPVLRELISKVQPIVNKMLALNIINKGSIPNFIFNPEPMEHKNIDFRRLAAVCYGLLTELHSHEINRIFHV